MNQSIQLKKKFIPIANPNITQSAESYVMECIKSTWISSSGYFLDQFSKSFAEFCDVKHAIMCNNGTTALHLALVCCGIEAGDEVIIPSMTYIATANCVKYCGAKPVFVDNCINNYNIDPKRIEEKITPRTKAIIPVHLFGHPCDMDPILEISERYGLAVIEDAAEAHGALYRGKKVGGFGRCASFSFFGNKIITTGEGGAVVTNDDELARKLILLRGQGMDPERRYWHPVVGYNYRMTNLAAAIGLSQLERIDEALAFRERLALKYDKALAGAPYVTTPSVANWAHHVFWMYTIQIDPSAPVSRDEFMKRLSARGIETRPVFHPVHTMPPYKSANDGLENACYCGAHGVSLPTHEFVTDEDVLRISDEIRDILS